MELEQIRNKKTVAENRIHDWIIDFYNETGLEVLAIHVTSPEDYPLSKEVKIEVERI